MVLVRRFRFIYSSCVGAFEWISTRSLIVFHWVWAGFSVMTDPIKACIVGSRGEYSWGGWASTVFWIDPSEDMVNITAVPAACPVAQPWITHFLLPVLNYGGAGQVVMQFAQLVPSDRYPLRRQLKVLTYQTIVDEDTPGNTLSYWEAN